MHGGQYGRKKGNGGWRLVIGWRLVGGWLEVGGKSRRWGVKEKQEEKTEKNKAAKKRKKKDNNNNKGTTQGRITIKLQKCTPYSKL